MANSFAYLVLLSWPFVSMYLYRRYDVLSATIIVILGAVLLLPSRTSIDYQFLPKFDKNSIMMISALFGILVVARKQISFLPPGRTFKFLFVITIVVPLLTVYGNKDPVFLSVETLRPYDYYSAATSTLERLFTMSGFLVGFSIVKTYEDQKKLFRWIVIAACLYCIPAIVEIRLSPQFHNWVYGFFPHVFAQHVRYGEFRPVVFMQHGLIFAFFMCIAFCCAITLIKLENRNSKRHSIIFACVLGVVLLFCRSLGPLILAFLFFVLVYVFPTRFRHTVILFICGLVMSYPVVTAITDSPHEYSLEVISSLDYERSQSLSFRYENEQILLDKAKQKPMFGWGGWGRSRVEGAVPDGLWIIALGQFGWVGLGAIFGLIAISIFGGVKTATKLVSRESRTLMMSHCAIVTLIFIDQIPNASISSLGLSWFFIGALVGRVNHIEALGRFYDHSRKIGS